jgi:2-methylcitrate dehydratase
MGASVDEIESAIGMCVAHYIPYRAIRAGKQLSDSKGASAAISTEAALVAIQRSMNGFIGPADIFRNPESVFRLNEPTNGDSPFNILLSHSGKDFAVMGMHFKLGLYEHQSAGAIQALLDAIQKSPDMLSSVDNLKKISIEIYEPAFGIIGDPAKRNPTTRQSADHSMVYIISSIMRKAFRLGPDAIKACGTDNNAVWKKLMLLPEDYGRDALYDPTTRRIFDTIEFIHGGKKYDDKYPEGIPTTLTIDCGGSQHSSDLVMFPGGHARNTANDLKGILDHKWASLGALAVSDVNGLLQQLSNLESKTAAEMQNIYDCTILNGPQID